MIAKTPLRRGVLSYRKRGDFLTFIVFGIRFIVRMILSLHNDGEFSFFFKKALKPDREFNYG